LLGYLRTPKASDEFLGFAAEHAPANNLDPTDISRNDVLC